MNIARTSADGGFDGGSQGDLYRNTGAANRGSHSAIGGKRTRPMTAKVRKNGIWKMIKYRISH